MNLREALQIIYSLTTWLTETVQVYHGAQAESERGSEQGVAQQNSQDQQRHVP
jgi:hypothetical protein